MKVLTRAGQVFSVADSSSMESVGRVITFYSYKGGTGRTMALANVAWVLASHGNRVLVLDWDLEAPGLHRYFAPFLSESFAQAEGLIEFFSSYQRAATSPLESVQTTEPWYSAYADLRRYSEPVDWPFEKAGFIEVVGAGRQDNTYAHRVTSFDWNHFYEVLGGGAFLDETVKKARQNFDYVLIDSRTGISDTSGICSIHLPDTLVALFTLNDQSIEGALNT